jgi:hypothetical protein
LIEEVVEGRCREKNRETPPDTIELLNICELGDNYFPAFSCCPKTRTVADAKTEKKTTLPGIDGSRILFLCAADRDHSIDVT